MRTSSKSRLVRGGIRQTAPKFGLSERDILAIELPALEPEALIGRQAISDRFDPAFFKTNFWFMWCTTFAFQPWHSAVEFKRYLVRFAHMVDGFSRLRGIMRTVYNQYDSMVRPLLKWLEDRGVAFMPNTEVTALDLRDGTVGTWVDRIAFLRDGRRGHIEVADDECVIVTLGSMTEASSLGSMDAAPVMKGKREGGPRGLWEQIAEGREQFGHPSVFADHIDQSKWLSFTATLHEPAFLEIVRDLTGNVPGEGGLVTFPDSDWLISIVIPHQPHFIGQPEGTTVFWAKDWQSKSLETSSRNRCPHVRAAKS